MKTEMECSVARVNLHTHVNGSCASETARDESRRWLRLTVTVAVSAIMTGGASAGLFDAIKNVANEAVSVVGEATSGVITVETNKAERADSRGVLQHCRTDATEDVEGCRVQTDDYRKDSRHRVGSGDAAYQKALRRYEDETEMPDCVFEVASYLRGDLTDALKRVAACSRKYGAFFSKMGVAYYQNPWEKLCEGAARIDIDSDNDCIAKVYQNWVVKKARWKDCPITAADDAGKKFCIGGTWQDGRWMGTRRAFTVKATHGGALKDDCQLVLESLRDLVGHLDNISKSYSSGKGAYLDRHAELHGGMDVPFKAYKDLSFGVSPFDVYEKFKDEMEGDGRRPELSSIPAFAWPESYQLKLSSHTLDLGFARFSEDDVAGLVFLRLSFRNGAQSSDALKAKYESLGFKFDVKREKVGKKWKDPNGTPEFILNRYGEAVMAVNYGGTANEMASDRAKAERAEYERRIEEIESKYMEDAYKEYVTAECNGYYLQFNAKGGAAYAPSTLSVVEKDGDLNQVVEIVIMDKATIDAQIRAYNAVHERQAAEEAKRNAAHEKQAQAAALDF